MGGDGASMEPATFHRCSISLTFQRINVLLTNEDASHRRNLIELDQGVRPNFERQF
jgi:hypothetical protein